MHAVELSQVTKRFGHSIVAVDNIDLTVPAGAFVTLLGPSGCGKTTTLRMIAGLESPSAGEIRIKGQRINELPIHKRNLGIVFQNYALFPHKTIAANVGFGLKYRNVAPDEIGRRVARALEMVRLPGVEERYPQQLSGGQQQRIALARALVIEPDVLLLDEPLSALDANLREEMRVEIKNIQRRIGIATVFVTHDQGEALAMSDHVVVMNKGKIEQIGAPREVYDRPRNAFVASFLGASNFVDGVVVARDAAVSIVETAAGRMPVHADAPIGRRVRIAVRPERVRVAREGETGLPARIRDVVYRGPVTHFYLDSAAGSLIAYRQNARTGDGSIGDDVRCAWDAEDAVVLDETPR